MTLHPRFFRTATHRVVSRLLLGALLVATMVGCGKREGGQSQCLGGANTCGVEVLTQNQTNTETIASPGNSLRCSAVANSVEVEVEQSIPVQVTTAGAQGSITISDGKGTILITNAGSSATFFKTYGADRVGQVVQETILVQDSKFQFNYCAYQVRVKARQSNPPDNSPQLACTITATPGIAEVGELTQFQLRALNTSGPATFTQFFGSSEWLLAEGYIQTITATEAAVNLIYTFAGIKSVSVQVTADGKTALCALQMEAR
jgi:hypothetical protein